MNSESQPVIWCYLTNAVAARPKPCFDDDTKLIDAQNTTKLQIEPEMYITPSK